MINEKIPFQRLLSRGSGLSQTVAQEKEGGEEYDHADNSTDDYDDSSAVKQLD